MVLPACIRREKTVSLRWPLSCICRSRRLVSSLLEDLRVPANILLTGFIKILIGIIKNLPQKFIGINVIRIAVCWSLLLLG